MRTDQEKALYAAINHGIAKAAAEFAMPADEVRALVADFATSPKAKLCPCEASRAEGKAMMCFACSGPLAERANQALARA